MNQFIIKNVYFIKIFFTILITLIISSTIYLYYFQFNDEPFAICENKIKYTLEVNSNTYEFLYLNNKCDDPSYFSSVFDLKNLFNEKGWMYQNRPLYIVSIKLLNLFFKHLQIEKDGVYVPILGFYFYQIIIVSLSLSLLLLNKYKIKKIRHLEIILSSLIMYSFPLIRYGIFSTSNQLTLILLFSIILYMKENKIDVSKFHLIFFGVLFMVNRATVIGYVYFLFKYLFSKNIKFNQKFINFFSSLIFFIPLLIYKIIIFVFNLNKFDINSSTYGQFIWLNNYLVTPVNFISQKLIEKPILNYKNYFSEWHCAKLPDNFICYYSDTLLLLKYLGKPLIFLIIFSIFFLKKQEKLFTLIQISIISYIFWSLIGWYPPIRFNLYSVGLLVIFFYIFNFLNIKNIYVKLLSSGSWIVICLQLNHWNVY